jgi:hypothetical protein
MAALSDGELTPILATQPGVCEVCRGWSSNFPRCFKCNDMRARFIDVPLPKVLPLALSVKHGPLAGALWAYKDHERPEVRYVAAQKLSGLIATAVPRHLPCLTEAAHGMRFGAVTYVPSGRHRVGSHPLRILLASDALLGPRLGDLLEVTPGDHPEHRYDEGKYSVVADVVGQSIVLVDDTWTTGGSALGAARALMVAGARAVAVMVIGRHFDPHYADHQIYSNYAESLGFDALRCTYCDTRPRATPPLPLHVVGS